MKSYFLAFFLIFTPQRSFAALCFETYGSDSADMSKGPCTPDPGADTEAAKQKIIDMITAAQSMDQKVSETGAEYIAAKKSTTDEEKLLAAIEPFYAAKIAQNQLYHDALKQAADLYHVSPDEQIKTVAKPYDPAMEWMSGLTATWDPQATDSGPDVMLAYKISAGDRDHFGGLTTMDPYVKNGRDALTLPDGRVFVLAGVFDIALKSRNPGILASVLYHESQHFDRLSWPSRDSQDAPGMTRSWASVQEEERDAYREQVNTAHIFGLSTTAIDNLAQLRDENISEIKNHLLDSFNPSQKNEENWEYFYEHKQINLEEAACKKSTVPIPTPTPTTSVRLTMPASHPASDNLYVVIHAGHTSGRARL